MRISDWSSDVCSSDLMDARPERTPKISTHANTEISRIWLTTIVQKMSRSSQVSRLILRVITQVALKSRTTSTITAGKRRKTRWRASEPGGIHAVQNLRSTFHV